MPSPAGKPDGPRLRRKLQKVSRQRNQLPERPVSAVSDDLVYNRCDVSPKVFVQEEAPLSAPPNHSRPQWLDYRRPGGKPHAISTSLLSRRKLEIPDIIPELSHLQVGDEKPRCTPGRLAVPHSASTSTTSTMRRRAKTPVYSIGQLEGKPLTVEIKPAEESISVEELAEQYRALLASRNSMFKDSQAGTPPPSHDETLHVGLRRQYSSDELSRRYSSDELSNESSSSLATSGLSPTSDDGTLVAFDEEAVYFKPVSFSTEPQSPVSIDSLPARDLDAATQPDSLSLQICIDLLSKELASVTSSRLSKPGSDTPALQIWVMIEAYERLRDQLHQKFDNREEKRTIEMMFDMWLRTLYMIHSSMARDDRSTDSEYETPSED